MEWIAMWVWAAGCGADRQLWGEDRCARCRTTGCGADGWVWCGPVGVVRTAGCGADDGCGALGAGTGLKALVRCGCGPPGVGRGLGCGADAGRGVGPLGVWIGLLGVERLGRCGGALGCGVGGCALCGLLGVEWCAGLLIQFGLRVVTLVVG